MKKHLRVLTILLIFNIQLVAQNPNSTDFSINSFNEKISSTDYNGNNDTISSSHFKQQYSVKKWVKSAIVPAGLITSGIIMTAVPSNTWFSKYSVNERITKEYPGFSTKLDNYLQIIPGIAVFTLKLSGVRSRSDLLNQGIIALKSQLLQSAVVTSLKQITHVQRPNLENFHSMPSGHTAEAFQLATMLDMEYRDVSPWISVGGYATAAATGAFRMLNNKHWDSDVMVGAGIGILSTKIIYLTHQYRWKQHDKTVILPVIYPKGGGLMFAMEL